MNKHVSETPVTRFLRQQAAVFSEPPYDYEERDGTEVTARAVSAVI